MKHRDLKTNGDLIDHLESLGRERELYYWQDGNSDYLNTRDINYIHDDLPDDSPVCFMVRDNDDDVCPGETLKMDNLTDKQIVEIKKLLDNR